MIRTWSCSLTKYKSIYISHRFPGTSFAFLAFESAILSFNWLCWIWSSSFVIGEICFVFLIIIPTPLQSAWADLFQIAIRLHWEVWLLHSKAFLGCDCDSSGGMPEMFLQQWPEWGMKMELVSCSSSVFVHPSRDPFCICGSVEL